MRANLKSSSRDSVCLLNQLETEVLAPNQPLRLQDDKNLIPQKYWDDLLERAFQAIDDSSLEDFGIPMNQKSMSC